MPTITPYHCTAKPENWEFWAEQIAGRKVFVICDTNTVQHCWPLFMNIIHPEARMIVCTIPAGEAHKTIQTCTTVWDAMTQHKLNRTDLVVLLGGGVVGDLGGFCAATYKRGVPFIMVPTTLLSMVDSSVGGKTGIDYQGTKNLVGTFAQAEHICAYPILLETLPRAEKMSGMAEVIKHAATGDRKLLKSMLASDDLLEQDWPELVIRSVHVKQRIVQRDPLERGLRKLLNFGHTIGHALESYWLAQGKPITHGHAVALGMLIELRHMKQQYTWSEQLNSLIIKHFSTEPIQQTTIEELWPYMLQDKKKSDNTIKVALPDPRLFTLAECVWERPGQVRFYV